MQKEIRAVCYDDDLHLEAYRFERIVQTFLKPATKSERILY